MIPALRREPNEHPIPSPIPPMDLTEIKITSESTAFFMALRAEDEPNPSPLRRENAFILDRNDLENIKNALRDMDQVVFGDKRVPWSG